MPPDCPRGPPATAAGTLRPFPAPALPSFAPRQTADAPPPAAPLRQVRGDGRQRSEASAPIGCVPGGGGHRGPQADQLEGEVAPPARAGRSRPRVTRARPWRAQKTLPAARGGLAPPPPARGLRRCCVTPAQRHLNTSGGAGATRQPPRSGRQRGILGWREARGWESPLTPTDSARARPETTPSSRGASRRPPARGRVGAGGKGGRRRLGSPTPLPRALRQAPPPRDCSRRGCAPLPCHSTGSAAAPAAARGRQGHPLRRRPGPPSPSFPRPARAPAAAAAAGGARRFPPPPRASTDLGEGARRSPPREPRPRPPPAGPRQGARADTPRPSVAARRGAARAPITSGCRSGRLPGGGWGEGGAPARGGAEQDGGGTGAPGVPVGQV